MNIKYQDQIYNALSNEACNYVTGHNRICAIFENQGLYNLLTAENTIGKYVSISLEDTRRVTYCRTFDGIFSTSRVKCTLHKYIKNILKIDIADHYVNKMIDILQEEELKHEVFGSQDIQKQYVRLSHYGVHSCMTGDECADYYAFLEDSGAVLHTMINEQTDDAVRAIVWEKVQSKDGSRLDNIVVMDRYYESGNLHHYFIDKVKQYYQLRGKTLILRQNNDMFCASVNSRSIYESNYFVKLPVYETGGKYKFPFMDSFCYMTKDNEYNYYLQAVAHRDNVDNYGDIFWNLQDTHGSFSMAKCAICDDLMSYKHRYSFDTCRTCADTYKCSSCGDIHRGTKTIDTVKLCPNCMKKETATCTHCGYIVLTNHTMTDDYVSHMCSECRDIVFTHCIRCHKKEYKCVLNDYGYMCCDCYVEVNQINKSTAPKKAPKKPPRTQ